MIRLIIWTNQRDQDSCLHSIIKLPFDTISKEYRVWAFKRFSFGENFVKWVEVLMKNTESCINYMGCLSQSIEVSSGIRQGCPFSPVAFILALELLAIKIRADPSVKGISVPRNHKCFFKTATIRRRYNVFFCKIGTI